MARQVKPGFPKVGWRGRSPAIGAVLLAAPLLVFLLLVYVAPISALLWRAVDNPEVVEHLPRTVSALADWDGRDLPPEVAFAALASDLVETQKNRTTAIVARRANLAYPGLRSLLTTAGNRVSRMAPPYRDAFIALNADWADPHIWRVLKHLGHPMTPDYMLAALDLRMADGTLERMPEERVVHVPALGRTLWISLTVCFCCLLLGLPAAMLLAWAPPRLAGVLMVCVLMPFWVSLLARTTAWIVLLQNEGLLNKTLSFLDLISEPLPLMFNRAGVLIAMTHVLLPYMVLPLYATFRSIPRHLVQAALSLGASPPRVLLKVCLPMAMPGIAAGCLLVIILALGYYITPALVGGAGDQMIAYFIAYHVQTGLNWGMAAALSSVLLVALLLLYRLYRQLAGPAGARLI